MKCDSICCYPDMIRIKSNYYSEHRFNWIQNSIYLYYIPWSMIKTLPVWTEYLYPLFLSLTPYLFLFWKSSFVDSTRLLFLTETQKSFHLRVLSYKLPIVCLNELYFHPHSIIASPHHSTNFFVKKHAYSILKFVFCLSPGSIVSS